MGVYVRGNGITIVQNFKAIDPLTMDATPADPTTVTFTIEAPDGTETVYTDADANVTNPQIGTWLCVVQPPLPAGIWRYSCKGAGALVAYSEGTFTIRDSGIPDQRDEPTVAVWGPCSPWITGDDVAAQCGAAAAGIGSNTYLLDSAADMGSQLMYDLSGRLFPGVCKRTVRPCRQTCQCFGQSMAAGLGPWFWTSAAYGAGGGFYWQNECGDLCGCGSESYIELDGMPVNEILQVMLDGSVLDPSGYRLDNRRRLIRLPDLTDPAVPINQWWPGCQDLSLPDTMAGTYSVTYTWGQEPPELGKRAAAQLACEIYQLMNVGECKLPERVTRVVRQGVTMDKVMPAADALRGGKSGLALVDMFLASVNPTGMRRRPAVFSPDRVQYGRKVGQ